MNPIILSSLLFAMIVVGSVEAQARKVQYCKHGGLYYGKEELDLSKTQDEACSQVSGGFQCFTKYNEDNKLTFTTCASRTCARDDGEEMRNACRETRDGRVCCCDNDGCVGDGYSSIIFTAREMLDKKKIEKCYKGGVVDSDDELILANATEDICAHDGSQCYTKFNDKNQLTYSTCSTEEVCKYANGAEMRNDCKSSAMGLGKECCCDSAELCTGAAYKHCMPSFFVLIIASTLTLIFFI
uniref:Uncharacterized protein n=1 Tax=Plectus sambesii TaxID=2011161 RepID=A0A914V987_9BILA